MQDTYYPAQWSQAVCPYCDAVVPAKVANHGRGAGRGLLPLPTLRLRVGRAAHADRMPTLLRGAYDSRGVAYLATWVLTAAPGFGSGRLRCVRLLTTE